MFYDSTLTTRAIKELLESWVWYEEQMAGLGDRFREEVYRRITDIAQNPERYPQGKNPYRETGIKTFPYLIIYKIDEERKLVIVISIFHTSRNPRSKYKN